MWALVVAVAVAVALAVAVDGRVVGVSALGDDGVEAVVLVAGVVDLTECAVGLSHLVEALDDVAVPGLVLALVVAGVRVVHVVLEAVLGVRLRAEREVSGENTCRKGSR